MDAQHRRGAGLDRKGAGRESLEVDRGFDVAASMRRLDAATPERPRTDLMGRPLAPPDGISKRLPLMGFSVLAFKLSMNSAWPMWAAGPSACT
jgi:hypothetical protein